MPEAVVLCSGLGIHGVQVVIYIALRNSFDFMLENFPTKCRLIWNIQWETVPRLASIWLQLNQIVHSNLVDVLHRDDLTRSDLLSRCCHACGSEQIETSNLHKSLA
jgi:hypothetical protein